MSSWDIARGRMSVDATREPDEEARRRARLRVVDAMMRGVILSDEELVQALDMLGLLGEGEQR